jgi:hypothetical protein
MKKINELYKEVAVKKENEVDDKEITMSREDFISEHKNLIKVLRSGDQKAQEAEAVKQEKELNDEVGDDIDEDEDEEDEEDED